MTAIDVGRHVRRLREDRKLSVSQLAQAIGVSPAFISLVESGERHLPGRRARQIADALEAPHFCGTCGRVVETA